MAAIAGEGRTDAIVGWLTNSDTEKLFLFKKSIAYEYFYLVSNGTSFRMIYIILKK